MGLVAAGAAAFAGIGAVTNVPVAPYIVTGVGFLAGSVIFREGATISGINSAATIWATAAVGALAGVGFYPEALAAAITIVLVNLLMEPMSRITRERIERRKAANVKKN
jgi:putative Mg2+ transporter-C (MgtC) family protein